MIPFSAGWIELRSGSAAARERHAEVRTVAGANAGNKPVREKNPHHDGGLPDTKGR